MVNRLLIEIREIIATLNYQKTDIDNYTVLKKVLQKMLEKSNISKNIFHDLFSNVVYIVLNRVPLNNPKERVFLAGINDENLNKKILNKILNTKNDDINTKNDDTYLEYANAFLVNPEGKKEIEEKIRNYWLSNWNVYYKVTTEKKNIIKYTTLNQSLLKHVGQPLNLGFYWGNEDDFTNDEYCYLPKSLVKKLGFDIEDDNWHDKLHDKLFKKKIYFNPEIKTETKEEELAINKIKVLYGDMMPKNPELFNDEGIFYILFHLFYRYAFWGGNSFISIPISFGLDDKNSNHSAVLSLCTTKPLNQDEYYKWTLIANKMFKDLIFEDVSKILLYEKKMEEIKKSYNMGHFLKNRVRPIITSLGILRRFVNLDPEIGKLPKDTLNRLKKIVIEKVMEHSNKLSNVGYLMDLTSIALNNKYEQDKIFFSNEQRYTKENKFDISKYFNENSEFKYNFEAGKPQNCKIISSPDSTIVIDTFLGKDNKKRPLDALYEELFMEIIINVAKYGKLINDSKELCIEYKKIDTNSCLIFQNEIPREEYNKLKKREIRLNNWNKLDSFFNTTGGLFYLVELLKLTKTGLINTKIMEKDNKYYFALFLFLQGIKNE